MSAAADALLARARELFALGRFHDARAEYLRAAQREPRDAQAFVGIGDCCWSLNDCDDAIAAYDRAIALNPAHALAMTRRGNVYYVMSRYEEALASFDAALTARPDFQEALYGRAYALTNLKRATDAAAAWDRLVELAPDYPYAAGMALQAKLTTCDWAGLQERIARVTEGVRHGKPVIAPYSFMIVSDSESDNAACAHASLESTHVASPEPLWRGERYRHRPIRLAYVSADYREHATAYLMAGVFEAHDRTRFETIGVSTGPHDASPMRARLEKAFDTFIDARAMSDLEVAKRLKQMEVDVAIDLKGYTQGCRPAIFASRVAPVQAGYLGYPGTMGTAALDYLIADRIVIPETNARHYSEHIVYLPHSYQCNDAARAIGKPPGKKDAGLPEHGFVFASFNNNYKIMPFVFDAWMRILSAVDGSVLWLLGDNDAVAGNLRREAEARGVSGERLIFAPRVPVAQHLARHVLADLFLDTLPYNAHTTASDALWTGVPVLTCLGHTFAGRVAGSLNHAIGLAEMTVQSLSDYEALALKLAREPALLPATKAKLARNRETHPLFDTTRITADLETAYAEMHARHQRGEKPAGFIVPGQTRA